MQEILNKEVLSEILGVSVTDVATDIIFIQNFIRRDARDNDIYYSTIDGEGHLINVYELAFKCKEWAKTKGKGFKSGVFYNEYIARIDGADVYFIAQTELDAIFKATKWVYDNIKGEIRCE